DLGREVARHLEVGDPLLAAHRGLEGLVVEVERIDLVPGPGKRLAGGGEQGAVVAGLDRVGVDNVDAHQAADTVLRPSNSQARPLLRSKSGSSQAIILPGLRMPLGDRKSTRLNSSHVKISYAVFCLKK